MKFNIKQIASILGGTIEGDENVEVWKLCKIEEGEPGGLSFLANTKYTNYIYDTKASAVIVSKDFVPEHPLQTTLLRRTTRRLELTGAPYDPKSVLATVGLRGAVDTTVVNGRVVSAGRVLKSAEVGQLLRENLR